MTMNKKKDLKEIKLLPPKNTLLVLGQYKITSKYKIKLVYKE